MKASKEVLLRLRGGRYYKNKALQKERLLRRTGKEKEEEECLFGCSNAMNKRP